MCGIAGTFKYHSSQEPSQEQVIKRMLASIKHRGPDETGIYLGPGIGLGSVRLSILDLASGQQPMPDVSRRYWIVYNGEIFNYTELRKHIQKKGVRLHTQSDTEVVVQMYALYGSSCLSFFNGQFAFCIWDTKRKELFLARDRVGIRPLFYWKENYAFAFCSEIKGLFTLGSVQKEIAPESMAQVFAFWTTLTPNTPFKNIRELPPGHHMTVDASGLTIEKYWSMVFPSVQGEYKGSMEDAASELTDVLKDAVKIRLRADVPVGAYLSGGLDSTVTTALIHEIDPGVLHTFSIGFKDKQFDETAYQAEVSRYFNTEHIAFECGANQIAEKFMNTVWHAEFPLLRTAPTPMFMLSKKVREQNIKVVITGEGADEVLAGYNIFKEAKIRRFWAKQPDSAIRPRLLSKLYPYLPMMKDANLTALKIFFGYQLNKTEDPLYSHLLRWHNTSRIRSFFSDDMQETIRNYDPLSDLYPAIPEDFMHWSDLARAQYLESAIFMSGYLLSSQGDRMAMGNSVEGRYPFLDYRVIEYCNKLPDRFKLNCLNEKFILKKLSKGKIPPSITERKKQPYRAPIIASFFNPWAPEYISDILSEKYIERYGLFHPQKVQKLVAKMREQKEIPEVDQMAVTGILSAQLLYKMFIEEPVRVNTDELQNVRIVRESELSYAETV